MLFKQVVGAPCYIIAKVPTCQVYSMVVSYTYLKMVFCQLPICVRIRNNKENNQDHSESDQASLIKHAMLSTIMRCYPETQEYSFACSVMLSC
mmetsp:Transcript_15388/g.25120  ORF Transcript_15388/g.25120 Transcript_15388/m.25120 type:complete len:93 (-) Transcript_15388:284-562(-)